MPPFGAGTGLSSSHQLEGVLCFFAVLANVNPGTFLSSSGPTTLTPNPLVMGNTPVGVPAAVQHLTLTNLNTTTTP